MTYSSKVSVKHCYTKLGLDVIVYESRVLKLKAQSSTVRASYTDITAGLTVL